MRGWWCAFMNLMTKDRYEKCEVAIKMKHIYWWNFCQTNSKFQKKIENFEKKNFKKKFFEKIFWKIFFENFFSKFFFQIFFEISKNVIIKYLLSSLQLHLIHIDPLSSFSKMRATATATTPALPLIEASYRRLKMTQN